MTGMRKRSNDPKADQKKLPANHDPRSNYSPPGVNASWDEEIEGRKERIHGFFKDESADRKARQRSVAGHDRATARTKAEIRRRTPKKKK